MSTANDGQPQCPFFFGLDERRIGRTGGGLGFPLDATEFFCVCQNEVHVLIKRQHLSRHLSTIIQRHSHAIVDEVLHLALRFGSHDAGFYPFSFSTT